MSFTFDATIPAAANNPSVDQPGMLQNNVATNGILAVDHVTFNALSGGTHKQVTLSSKNVPGAQTDPQSVLYSNNITGATATNTISASTVASAFYRNQNAIYPVSMIRAFGAFDAGGTSLNTWNMSATRTSAGKFNITLATNAVTGFNYLVLLSNTGNNTFTFLDQDYSINTGTGQINIQFGRQGSSFDDPLQFSVLVLQL
jgi:hypothetical protein